MALGRGQHEAEIQSLSQQLQTFCQTDQDPGEPQS
jgi:hypothetical protein